MVVQEGCTRAGVPREVYQGRCTPGPLLVNNGLLARFWTTLCTCPLLDHFVHLPAVCRTGVTGAGQVSRGVQE